MNKVVYNYC